MGLFKFYMMLRELRNGTDENITKQIQKYLVQKKIIDIHTTFKEVHKYQKVKL